MKDKTILVCAVLLLVAVRGQKEEKDEEDPLLEPMMGVITEILMPTINLFCCNDPKVQPELLKCIDCIPKQALKDEFHKKADGYIKKRGQLCNTDGTPNALAINATIDKELDEFKVDPKKDRFFEAVCIAGCIPKLKSIYAEDCKLND